MTDLQEALQRPEFETVSLDVTPEEAHRQIDRALEGLAASESPEGTKFRTTDGMLVAIVGERGDGKSTLAYRTEPASELATRKASKIREALKPYEAKP